MPRSILEGGTSWTGWHVVSSMPSKLQFNFQNPVHSFTLKLIFILLFGKCRYCPTCKEHRQATKKLDLWRLPDILVVHLKRFSYSRYLKNKLDTFVNFQLSNLDLSQYVMHKDATQSHMYELYAVSNHYGGLGGGHYSAYVKVKSHNQNS